jgi:Pentapeptide repeats (8 copies)
MQVFERRAMPQSWREWRARKRRWWVAPFALLEYGMEWVVYALSHWTFLEVLEYLGRFGVLVAVIFYFAESGDRRKQKHYQAWQVINSAEGKGGNGGRIEALEELNADGVSLVGVNLSSAFLMGVQLPKGKLARANFDAADARNSNLSGSRVTDASLRSANFRGARLEDVSFARSVLSDADFTGADLRNADLTETDLENADLRNADLQGVAWGSLQSVKGANVLGVKNAPSGMLEWMIGHGAVRKEER